MTLSAAPSPSTSRLRVVVVCWTESTASPDCWEKPWTSWKAWSPGAKTLASMPERSMTSALDRSRIRSLAPGAESLTRQELEGVGPRAAGEPVGVGAAGQDVGPVVAAQLVVAAEAVQLVLPGAADDGVGPVAAAERVLAVAGDDDAAADQDDEVVAVAAGDHAVGAAGVDQVVAPVAEDLVAAAPAADGVRAGAAGDVVVGAVGLDVVAEARAEQTLEPLERVAEPGAARRSGHHVHRDGDADELVAEEVGPAAAEQVVRRPARR